MSGRSWLARILFMCLAVLMLFAVLSTATYAWYSMSNRVSAEKISFVAGSNSDGGDLAVSWREDVRNSYTLTFNTCTDKLSPMIPKDAATVGETGYDDFLFFNSTSQALNEYGEWICRFIGVNATPYTLTGSPDELDPSKEQGWFYLINRNETLGLKVTLNYEISGELQGRLRIAIFIGSDEDSTVFHGILSRTADIHYGRIQAGDKVSETPVMEDVFARTGSLNFNIAADSHVVIRLVAWLDGVDMTDYDGDKETVFSMQFTGELA